MFNNVTTTIKCFTFIFCIRKRIYFSQKHSLAVLRSKLKPFYFTQQRTPCQLSSDCLSKPLFCHLFSSLCCTHSFLSPVYTNEPVVDQQKCKLFLLQNRTAFLEFTSMSFSYTIYYPIFHILTYFCSFQNLDFLSNIYSSQFKSSFMQ